MRGNLSFFYLLTSSELVLFFILITLPSEEFALYHLCDMHFILAEQVSCKIGFELNARNVAVKLTVKRNRDRAGFLGYDEHQGVAVFTHTDSRAVSCAKLLDYLVVCRKRKETARRIDPAVADDHSAVVKRCFVEEYVAQKE